MVCTSRVRSVSASDRARNCAPLSELWPKRLEEQIVDFMIRTLQLIIQRVNPALTCSYHVAD